jgi:hypothetical protein
MAELARKFTTKTAVRPISQRRDRRAHDPTDHPKRDPTTGDRHGRHREHARDIVLVGPGERPQHFLDTDDIQRERDDRERDEEPG